MSQESQLAIVKQENISTILSIAPQSYQDNKDSCEKCVNAGQNILNAITDGGMSDELDQQAAIFIEKARKTLKKMNEKRSPVTKLFDDIRREFTAIENTIDPSKADTIPYKLQLFRNQYATKKRAEDEARRLEEYARQQAEVARTKMKQDVEDDFNQQFNTLINQTINTLTSLDNSVTLDNYSSVFDTVSQYATELPADWLYNLHTLISIPAGIITVDELRKVAIETKERLEKKFKEMYANEVKDNIDYIVERLPSKKANLERIAQSDAVEAARIKAEMEERQRKDAEAQEAERQRKEEEEHQKAELARSQSDMNSLFAAQASVQGYQPNVKVAKKIELLNPEGIMPIISLWWAKEGCILSTDELSKIFKKQITFCEKLANRDGITVEDESVAYIDDVKAK
ncbi:MAG: hypothetical protein RSA66_08585 [Muribaculaceae bacterium]